MHSLGGGTGSGLGSLLMDKLSQDYSEKMLFGFSIFPGSSSLNVNANSDVVTEPYNALFTVNSLIQSSQIDFVLENTSLYRICQN